MTIESMGVTPPELDRTTTKLSSIRHVRLVYNTRDVLPHPRPWAPPRPNLPLPVERCCANQTAIQYTLAITRLLPENNRVCIVHVPEESRDKVTILSIAMALPGARANYIPATGNVSPPSRSSQTTSPIPVENRFDLLVNGQVV